MKLQIPFYLSHIFCLTQNPNYSTLVRIKAHISCYMIMMPTARVKAQICTLPLCAHRPKGKKMFICTTHRLPHLRPPCAAGLRPRGDESDQSDQSTEITVIPEVRGRAPGHSEFTHPAQGPDKSAQEWQTFVRMIQ